MWWFLLHHADALKHPMLGRAQRAQPRALMLYEMSSTLRERQVLSALHMILIPSGPRLLFATFRWVGVLLDERPSRNFASHS